MDGDVPFADQGAPPRLVLAHHLRERLEAQNCDIIGGTSEALAELVKSEQAKWGRIIREKHITVD